MGKFIVIGERIHCISPVIREAMNTMNPEPNPKFVVALNFLKLPFVEINPSINKLQMLNIIKNILYSTIFV